MNLTHLTPDQLSDYFDNLWLPEMTAAIEQHLAKCDECAALARRIFEAQGLIDSWTAKKQKGSR
jgi:anti-sigma factor RsiW